MNDTSLTFPWASLIDWYEEHGRHDLEWRDYTIEQDILAYRVWLSEIFLQQTQVERVRGYFMRILEVYPTVHTLAKASYEEFFPYYQGMGYYSRARNLLKTASILSEVYKGEFPREKSLLMKLPGVGGYTSSALLAFGFGEAYLAWDTNLEKVFARYFHGSRLDRLTEREKEAIEADFRDFIHSCSCIMHSGSRGIGGGNDVNIKNRGQMMENSVATPEVFGTFDSKSTETEFGSKNIVRTINNALMDFAATIDLKNPQNIDWTEYPIQSGKFYETRGALEPKEIKKSQSFPTPDAAVIVILHKDHKEYYSPHESYDQSICDDEWKSGVPKDFLHLVSRDRHDLSYSPFILPPSLTRDTRKYVQDFFREKYGLELSVRPVHKKWISEEGKPYVVVNAQIQTGIQDFILFRKK